MIFRNSFSPFQSSLLPTFRSLAPAIALAESVTWSPQVHGAWVDDHYELSVDLPGIPESAVHVSVAGRTLTLEVDHGDEQRQLRWSERLRLPQTLDPEQVTAHYRDGRLTVMIARTAQPEARVIKIDTSPPVSQIAEASSVTEAQEAPADTTSEAPAEAATAAG